MEKKKQFNKDRQGKPFAGKAKDKPFASKSKDREDKPFAGKSKDREDRSFASRTRDKDFHEERREVEGIVYGRNPVAEAVKSGRQIDKIVVAKETEGSINKILGEAKEKGIQIRFVDRAALDKTCQSKSHQGIMAHVAPVAYREIEDMIALAKEKDEDIFLILLDGMEDPHNLGAIIRSADAAGAHGVIIPNRRAVGLTETVAKASAGAIEYVPVAKVANITQTIEKLKKMGIWVGAVDMDGEEFTKRDLKGNIALVIGGEGQGVGKLVKETCDFVVSMPMKGKVTSLNASNAAAVMMYEVVRQRGV